MTFFPISHYTQPWLLIPGINIFLMVVGGLIHHHRPRFGKFVFRLGLLSLGLFSTPFIAYNMVDVLQNKYPMLPTDKIINAEHNDAIVVLGGGDARDKEFDNKLTVSDSTLHRLKYAAWLHEQTHLPVIVSGGKSHADLPSEADLMATVLHDQYQIDVAYKEDKSQNTADESTYLATLLNEHQLHRVYLVTNAWHMPRSVYIFSLRNIKVTPAPMGYMSYGPGYALISFLPNIHALYASSIAWHEFIGWMGYRLYYGSVIVR